MYSVRVTTRWHGDTQIQIFVVNVVVTGLLIWQMGWNYLTIFCASTLLHLVIETGLALSGIRKGTVYVYGVRLPRWADVALRATVDGPGLCVPAFLAADLITSGNVLAGVLGTGLLVAAVSLYMGLADRRDLDRLGPNEAPIYSRRAMNRPGAMMLLSLLNTICLAALFLMPAPYRIHAFTYVGAYSLSTMLFYAINYPLGVRYVQLYDCERKEYTTPGPWFQAAGLTYDSAYEMALLISPAYWITFYLGLFQYPHFT
ncbi:MAG: hypothetical protein AAFV53_24940 [Myxococcota bacterium]